MTIISDWLSLGWQQVHPRASCHWLCQTWGKFLAASQSPPSTKAWPHKTNTLLNKGDKYLLKVKINNYSNKELLLCRIDVTFFIYDQYNLKIFKKLNKKDDFAAYADI